MKLLSSLLLLTLSACQASAPPVGPGPGGDSGPLNRQYPTLAACNAQPACPGEGCPQNAVGPPDQVVLNTTHCETLQLSFTTGAVVATDLGGQPELQIYLGGVAGLTRIEASQDGVLFHQVGWIGDSTLPVPGGEQCRAQVINQRAQVHLRSCNYVPDVLVLRLIREQGALLVDAVEALALQGPS